MNAAPKRERRWFRSRTGTYGLAWILRRRSRADGSRCVRVFYCGGELESARRDWTVNLLQAEGVRFLKRRPSPANLRSYLQ